MAGRGFSLKDFKKKTDLNSEDAESTESSLPFIQSAGRGRGITLPPLQVPSSASVASTSIGIGRGVIMGRGMFALKPVSKITPPSTVSSSDKIGSENDMKGNSASSGIIAGRGFSTSGRGTGGIGSGGTISGRGTGTISGRGSSGMSIPQVTPTPVELPPGEPVLTLPPVLQTPVVVTRAPSPPGGDPAPVQKMYNIKSKEISGMANLIELHIASSTGIFEYQVVFSPPVDNMNFRAKYLGQHRDVIGQAKTFDGVVLFLPRRLPEEVTVLHSKNIADQSEIKVEIIYKREKSRADCVQLYNILFERIFRILNYLRVGRKNFDPTAPQLIPKHKLEIWPGYVKAVDLHENDRLLLTLDVSHRVLSTRSVLDVMKEAFRSNRDQFKDSIKKCLIGSIVLTRYNNKCYRVDDIQFDKNPKSTFEANGTNVSFMEYYKSQYNINIQDDQQYLLLSRMEVRISGEKEKREYMVNLVPELCTLTGLSDVQRSNFHVMKDVATYTKLTPLARVTAFKKFLTNVNSTPAAKEVLNDWGLTLDLDPLQLSIRVLNEEIVAFGRGKEAPAGPQADFSRHATTNQVLEPIDLVNWLLVYTKNDKNTAAKSFEEMLFKVCGSTGMHVAPPRHVELPNDRTETYVAKIREELTDAKIQIVVCIFPTMRDDRYSAVKKVLCAEIPVPSQCINSKTLSNDAKNRSIVLKILLQMNCKMGGTLWGIKIPLKNTMICGIDTYHETGHNGITVGGLVASLNPSFTRWWSKPTIQEKREELVNGLTASMEGALRAFKTHNGYLPDRIILYRDGVGDGQINFVQQYEIPQFKAAFKRIDSKFEPKLTFVIVQKRINVKFFIQTKMGKDPLTNPPPGSVLDHTVVNRELYDFFLVSQHVREGTTTPSRYIVLEDQSKFEAEILQRITYKLCYLYYNWPGTVRVPAPCQYAHKLADLVGLSVKREVGEKLANKLYYL